MRTRIWHWLRMLLGGAMLFAAAESSCVADSLRDVSSNLDELANDFSPQDEEETIGDFIDELLD
jgi:hypothetical protein